MTQAAPPTPRGSVVAAMRSPGGSILASCYAAFGDELFTRFEPDYLHVDIEDRLLMQAVTPGTLWHLTSPWYGRGHMLAAHLDELLRGKTCRDAAARPDAPPLVVTATDPGTGLPFEFNPEQFAFGLLDG